MQVASDIMVLHLGNRCPDPSAGRGGGDPRAEGADTAGAADAAAGAEAGAAALGGEQGAQCVPRSLEVCESIGRGTSVTLCGNALVALLPVLVFEVRSCMGCVASLGDCLVRAIIEIARDVYESKISHMFVSGSSA
jgi:hypothetical protein